MKKEHRENRKHCCPELEHYLDEQKVLIFYNPIFREYYIGLRSSKNGRHPIYHCPWCGKKFSSSLIDRYIETLSDEYGISYDAPTGKYFNIQSEDFDMPDEAKTIPQEFKDETWWKQRNL